MANASRMRCFTAPGLGTTWSLFFPLSELSSGPLLLSASMTFCSRIFRRRSSSAFCAAMRWPSTASASCSGSTSLGIGRTAGEGATLAPVEAPAASTAVTSLLLSVAWTAYFDAEAARPPALCAGPAAEAAGATCLPLEPPPPIPAAVRGPLPPDPGDRSAGRPGARQLTPDRAGEFQRAAINAGTPPPLDERGRDLAVSNEGVSFDSLGV